MTGRVHLKQDFSGRPSGEVFVEFASNDEAGCAWDCGRFKVQLWRYLGDNESLRLNYYCILLVKGFKDLLCQKVS